MAKRPKEDESVGPVNTTETAYPSPTNGDSEPAKKPPRDKVAAFKKVGNDRVQKAIYAMRRLLPLANRNAYTYTPEQAKVMRDVTAALAAEVAAAFPENAGTEEQPATFF